MQLQPDWPDLDEDSLWRAVLERDDKADGAFVYGVLSTRIFCRASCPSRRPRRPNARFFASPQSAIQAGFRACKRCRPEEFASAQVARARHACQLIEARNEAGEGPLSLDDLSRAVGSSAGHLQRTFKQVTGISPREYADALRLGQFKERLREGEPIVDALYDAGFGSSRGLYERAPSQLGMTPSTYGRGGLGARIRFATSPCALGFLLVAATESGICAASLGDSPAQLEADLRAEFPQAEVQADDGELNDWLQPVLGILEGREPHKYLPLDVRATAFQWRVWRELKQIGAGQTRTYSQVAQVLGAPSAVRAVARACATNSVALVVPCHRVVRVGGALAGYRWGLERKKKLLETEKAALSQAASTCDDLGGDESCSG